MQYYNKIILKKTMIMWLLPFAFSLAMAQPDNSIQWHDFDAGMAKARASDKYAFIEVYTDWCTYCKQMEEVTFKSEPVLNQLKEKFVPIKLNAEATDSVTWQGEKYASNELATIWGVTSYPTMLFFNSEGKIVGAFPSYADPDLMVKLLSYISTGAREKNIAFEEFLSQQES